MSQLKPLYNEIQTVYDQIHSTDLIELFLDPTLMYSCAYFERDDMSLEEAQYAKLDLSLGKCDLKPGQTLLEVGCGWGKCAFRAAEKYGVNVIGLTLSRDQVEYCQQKMQELPSGAGQVDIRLQGWEEFDEPVDSVVSIGAFEHFPRDRHPLFFDRCRAVMPDNGRMLLHCIVRYDLRNLEKRNVKLTPENIAFAKFISREIFPGGKIYDPDEIMQTANAAGLEVLRTQTLGLHYARTLETWAENLTANRQQVVELKSAAVYNTFMKYLVGCADHFRSGHIDLYQFTLQATP